LVVFCFFARLFPFFSVCFYIHFMSLSSLGKSVLSITLCICTITILTK
jgi:hypothetical protein